MATSWLGKKDAINSQHIWLYTNVLFDRSSRQIERNEMRLTIDLDADRPNRRVGNNGVYFFKVKQSATIRLEYLRKYLQGEIGWDNHVLECMSMTVPAKSLISMSS